MSTSQFYRYYKLPLAGCELDLQGWATTAWEKKVPYTDFKLSLHYPGTLFSSIFFIGLGTTAYFGYRLLRNLGKNLMTYFKSVSNASKYLNPTSGR